MKFRQLGWWIFFCFIIFELIVIIFPKFSPQTWFSFLRTWPWGMILAILPLWILALAVILLAINLSRQFATRISELTQPWETSNIPQAPSQPELTQPSETGNAPQAPSQMDDINTLATLKREAEQVSTTFKDVGGQEEAKKTLEPVINWLKHPKEKVLGAEVPRGILLAGPSGSGKTLFARAIAGTAQVPFFYYSSSEFAELLTGVGYRRIKDLFLEARQEAAEKGSCIVFIDQIDFIAGERSPLYDTIYGKEEQQTLLQLLREMDNLAENGRVYVLAATNRPRVLDPTLTRPGRLSLRIDLSLPDKDARKTILDLYIKQKGIRFISEHPTEPLGSNDRPMPPVLPITPLQEPSRAMQPVATIETPSQDMNGGNLSDKDVESIAVGTEGWSAAELEEMVSQAAEVAEKRNRVADQGRPSMKRQRPKICLADFIEVKGRILPKPEWEQPTKIVAHLDQFVIGQADAKMRLAVAVSNHYLRLGATRQFTVLPTSMKKSNVLLMGPTGSGKTLLIETIAEYLEVPYVIFNSTVLTETGHLGANVEQVLYKLLEAATMNLRKAEYGIICIDEFDKIAFRQGERTRSSAAAVQQELLKIVEGAVVDVPKTGGERRTDNIDFYQFNTRNILFVCLGAFADIEIIIERRLAGTGKRPRQELLECVKPEDVIEYGFIPELIGRFPVITFTKQLTEGELAETLQHKDGLVNEYKTLLTLQGWQPEFEDGAIKCIAQEAARSRTGARSLRKIMEDVLLEAMFKRPDHQHIEVRSDGHESRNDKDSEAAHNHKELLIIKESTVKQALKMDQPLLNDAGSRTVEKIFAMLDKRLVGNVQAKRTLAIVSANHYSYQTEPSKPESVKSNGRKQTDPYKRLIENMRAKRAAVSSNHNSYQAETSDISVPETAKSNGKKQGILLVDPYTGQRLRIIQELADILQVPCARVSAMHLEHNSNSKTGQRLTWLSEPVYTLLQNVNDDVEKARQGIIFIDDFDQILSKDTVRSSYGTLQELLGGIIQGRSLSLQSSSGYEINFKTEDLLFVLGGDFRFPGQSSLPFEEDPSFVAKYQPGKILSNLITDFGLSMSLLQYLIVVTMDLSVSDSDLEQIIRKEYEQLQDKYRDLLIDHKKQKKLSSEEYRQLLTEARDGFWKVPDIRRYLESKLMEHLYNSDDA